MQKKCKIVFLDAASIGEDVSLAPVAKLGKLITYPFTKPEEVAQRISSCDILIINKVHIGKEQIDTAPGLKLICVAATGTNNVDIEYAKSKGIPVRNVAGYSTDSVAQVTMAMLLNLTCHIDFYDHCVKSGEYSEGNLVSDVRRKWGELTGQRLGIIGFGNIGAKVASLAKNFRMEVVYHATSGKPHSSEYKHLSLEELLSSCDFISVHAPLNPQTSNLITYDKLKLCKPSAKIINIGRGGIINEKDLVKALNEELIEGIGVDVYSNEPLPSDSPYFKIKDKTKALLLPHIGWTSRQARTLLIDKIAENISSFLGWVDAISVKSSET